MVTGSEDGQQHTSTLSNDVAVYKTKRRPSPHNHSHSPSRPREHAVSTAALLLFLRPPPSTFSALRFFLHEATVYTCLAEVFQPDDCIASRVDFSSAFYFLKLTFIMRGDTRLSHAERSHLTCLPAFLRVT
eukprot:1215957-Pleurochrysis_carterae.AAC.3